MEAAMLVRMRLLLSLVLLLTALAFANDKKKNLLPTYVLKARTVLGAVSRDSGLPVTDPAANRTAQEDVEKAIMKWGRLTPVMDAQTADRIITVRKGHGRVVEPTINGGPVNDRPVVLEPTDGGVRIGGRKGRAPDLTGSPTRRTQNPKTHPPVQIGPPPRIFSLCPNRVARPPPNTPL